MAAKRGVALRYRRFLTAVVLAFLTPVAGWAATTTPATASARFEAPVILLIDMQRMDESMAAKSVQKQLEQQRSKFQTETEAEEDELRKAEDELNKARDHLSGETYTEREQQLRQRFLTVERHVQARRKVLDQGFSDSTKMIRSSLLDIVQEVAHARGANLVLDKQQALWADENFDITNEVLDRLNKKMPQVTVKLAPEEKN